MLLEFSIKNFLSFKEEITFSMHALENISGHERDNLYPVGKQSILKTAVIYGANASGKSNLIIAMGYMRHIVAQSLKLNPNDLIDFKPFALSPETLFQPTEVEVSFLHQDIYYRYGFRLDDKRIHKEWLYFAPEEEEIKLFERIFHQEQEKYSLTITASFEEGRPFLNEEQVNPKFTSENTLFLAVVAKFGNGNISKEIMDWFTDRFNIISDTVGKEYTIKKLQDQQYENDILRLMQQADKSIKNIHLNQLTEKNLPLNLPKELKEKIIADGVMILVERERYNLTGEKSGLGNLPISLESEGTRKLFGLSGPLIETLKKGETLVIDELDSKLHPMIIRFIISLFQSTKTNPYHAQLIFATHDTNLLSSRFFRRDQIWFTEKNPQGATDLYSLADFNIPQETEDYKPDYFKGKYGAIPYIGDFKIAFGVKN